MTSLLTYQQSASLSLMQKDLRFLYTVIEYRGNIKSNYIMSSMPYIGLIIDGIENWIRAYNNSHTTKLNLPTFTSKEQKYYEKLRSRIKLWENSYADVYNELKRVYLQSDEYFANICMPTAKALKLYDIFGVDLADGNFCGNTILCSYYLPDYDFQHPNGEELKEMGVIGGKYVALFKATSSYSINTGIMFSYDDYGGFVKSSVGNTFSDKFVLFSLLCQTNYIIKCIRWL